MNWETLEFYQRNPDAIAGDLAKGLKEGALCLMTGAGISEELNLPLWHELVVSCCNQAPSPVDTSGIDDQTPGETLLLRMESVRAAFGDDTTYLQAVYNSLYQSWARPSISEAPALMRAIGMLTMGSVRGRVRTVMNFNFDSLLEWYLTYHGYVVQVVEDVPRGLVNSDVQVFHPHGYLPLEAAHGNRSSMIVFDKGEQETRLTNRADAWSDVYRYVLGTQVFIALGLGGNDPMVSLMIAAADRQRRHGDTRPVGFWFSKRGSLNQDLINNLRRKHVVIVEVADYPYIADKLFDIGQKAAGPVII